MGVGVPGRQLHLQLLVSDSSFGAIEEEDEGAGAPPAGGGGASSYELLQDFSDEQRQFSWRGDCIGIMRLFLSTVNFLLFFVPLGFLSQAFGWSAMLVFWFNFIALLPLAALLGAATEELALHTGEIIGGLLNATFGNAVELILSVQALKKGYVTVVQGTLLGSILSNLLLVLGMSFFFGGLTHHVQRFNAKGATCNTSLLLLSSLGIAVPTVGGLTGNPEGQRILMISRITAIVIAGTYVMFLFFQLYTHISLFSDDDADEDQDEEWPSMSWVASLAVLGVVTLLVSMHSEYLVGSIEPVVTNYGFPRDFIGVILLPIVGNAAEHVTAVTVAVKDKVDLTMGVAVGSSAQIALFVVPFTVIMGWIMDVPMTLAFPPLSAIVLILAILVVLGVVQDGESNWLEGVMLMAAYVIIAVTYWYGKPSEEWAR
eukprot:GHVS01032513.1.p1 GENE.GHVS01032513.1~~GHVS01032513.1.p1  ORF type:complete len:469 (-),score=57.89 GHVS01032513.1:158-1444(-)